MNFNKIVYPKCPHCKIEINDLDFIPLGRVGRPFSKEVSCPNPKCKEKFYLTVRLELLCEASK